MNGQSSLDHGADRPLSPPVMLKNKKQQFLHFIETLTTQAFRS